MNNESRQMVLVLKGMISELPLEAQRKVKDAEVKMRAVLAEYDEATGQLALALVSSDFQQ